MVNALLKILDEVNADNDLNKDSVIEKIKKRLKASCLHMYDEWEKDDFDVNWVIGSKKHTLLHLASAEGYKKVVEALIENKADVNKANEDGAMPLHSAAEGGNLEIVKYLIKEGIDKNKDILYITDLDGYIPLHSAAVGGNLEIVKYLIEEQKVAPNVKKHFGDTPLHVAAEHGNLEIVKYLIEEQKVAPDVKNDLGDTPLDIANENDHLEIVEYLVDKKKVAPDVKNNSVNAHLRMTAEKKDSKPDIALPEKTCLSLKNQASKDLAEDENMIQRLKAAGTKHINKAMTTGFTLGIITMLTVVIGCVVTNVGLSTLAIAGISLAVALIVGGIASGITYTVLKPSGKLNELNVSEQYLLKPHA